MNRVIIKDKNAAKIDPKVKKLIKKFSKKFEKVWQDLAKI